MTGLTGDSDLTYIGGRQTLSPVQQNLHNQIILCELVVIDQEYTGNTKPKQRPYWSSDGSYMYIVTKDLITSVVITGAMSFLSYTSNQ